MEEQENEESQAPGWALAVVLGAFKLFTVGLVILIQPTGETIGLTLATSWPWLVVGLALVASPALFWLRLLRVRRKRKRLLQAEWHID